MIFEVFIDNVDEIDFGRGFVDVEVFLSVCV